MILAEAPPDRLTRVQQLAGQLARPVRFLTSLSVDNTEIGEAMLQSTLEGRHEGVIENREIRALADRYQAARGDGRAASNLAGSRPSVPP